METDRCAGPGSSRPRRSATSMGAGMHRQGALRTPQPGKGAPEGNLHGFTAAAIGVQLYRVWLEASKKKATHSGELNMAVALVYLRQSGRECYDVEEHRRWVSRQVYLTDRQVRSVISTAFPIGTRVCVLGEDRWGIVIHLTVGRDSDSTAAAWYVVATPARGICRAHGTDEIELR